MPAPVSSNYCAGSRVRTAAGSSAACIRCISRAPTPIASLVCRTAAASSMCRVRNSISPRLKASTARRPRPQPNPYLCEPLIMADTARPQAHPFPPDVSFDGGDLDCGNGLLLLIRKHIDPMAKGQLLEILSTEISVDEDLPVLVNDTRSLDVRRH